MKSSEGMYHWVHQICPICEIPPTKFLGQRGGAAHRQRLGVKCDIWRCGQCGLIFPNPMPIPVNGLEQHYGVEPSDYFEHHDLGQKDACAADLLHTAQSLLGKKGRLLDIGAGRGEVLRIARQENWHAVGIELSPTFAAFAARHSGAEILREPLEECGFKDQVFDAVILAAVLEHLYNPDQTIREIARILRPGGVLFLDVPNEAGLYFRIGNLYQKLMMRSWVVNLAPTFSPFHVFGFTPKSLRAILSKYNFKPTEWHIYPGISLVPAHGGLTALLEQQAAKAVTSLSKYGELGTYIATWAIKV